MFSFSWDYTSIGVFVEVDEIICATDHVWFG